MFTLIIIFLLVKYVCFSNVTDMNLCKLSHLGVEYVGNIATTESRLRCQSWTATKPMHKIDESFTDDLFPERSMLKAKNYCRNPNQSPSGPWCYTLEESVIDEECEVPLCTFVDCKITGRGMEYAGTHNRGRSGKKCLKWDKHRKKVRDKHAYYEQPKFSKRKFPDESRGQAKKFCRNPDGDLGGPWCFVDLQNGVVEKEFCDIPFCDSYICETFTTNQNIYSHYTFLNESITNITFGIKLWDSDSYLNASARILLSLFTLPLTGTKIDDIDIGIEIFISNKHSAMTIGNKATVDYEESIGVLKSYEYTFFSLMWNNGFVTLSLSETMKSIFLAEYKWKKKLFSLNKNRFFYYSIQGTNVIWSLPFCDEDNECEIHITTAAINERFWPLQISNASYDLRFYVRGFHSSKVTFLSTPVTKYPRFELSLFTENNTTKIIMYEYEGSPEILLKSVTVLKLLDYWKWREFLVTFFGDTIQLYWVRDIGTQLLLEVNYLYVSWVRWFSPSSMSSTTLWTFFCSPKEFGEPPPPWLPECVLNKDERNYKGTQSVTADGNNCLPWYVVPDIQTKIDHENSLKLWNYCRDPFEESTGTYCYTTEVTGTEFVKKKCKIRLCKSAECRMAGTGNDYIGKINITRSNRTCQRWTENKPHQINEKYLNYTLYADQDLSAAENFCRDPSRNIAGPWCYTTDSNVPMDICNIQDCDKTEQCTIMTKGNGEGRYIYILPQWKDKGLDGGLRFSLKEWNPDLLDGIIIEVTPHEGHGFIKLVVGADQNEHVLLYHGKNRETMTLKKEKTLPHLIPAGKWGSFWLQIRKGEILLGYENVGDPLFEWIQDDDEYKFEPIFLTYMSIQGNIIGVNFKCSECHTERTETSIFTRIMPLGLWSSDESTKSNITFYIRGTGIALIPLILLPGTGNYYGITIGDFKTWILITKNKGQITETLKGVNLTEPPLKPNTWSTYMISYTEYSMEIFRNNKSVLFYESKVPMLFYWFSVGAENGWITWTANCVPPDIDGPPQDGGWSMWSDWQCSLSCGGGNGVRYRTCSNPYPNIFGQMCQGDHMLTGRCNEFDCGDLSPKTLDTIRLYLKKNHSSYEVDEGTEILLKNNDDILTTIKSESPNSYYIWYLNGVDVKPRADQIQFINDEIFIKETSISDTGVYICMLYRVNGKRLVIQVISLAVIPAEYNLITRETYKMTLISNAITLAYVYTDLSQKWLINDQVFHNYGLITLVAVSSEEVSSVNYSHDGLWRCIVEEKDLKLSWITNIVRVQVKKRPNLLTHLMEDAFTSPLFGKFPSEIFVLIFILFITIFVFVSVYVCLYLYLKYGTFPQKTQ